MYRIDMFQKGILALLVSFISHSLYANENLGLNSIEESLAVATLMSDSEALTFGFTNVDLAIVGNDPNLGDDASRSYRNSLDVFVLPYTWDLEPRSDVWEHAITVRAFFIKTERDLSLSSKEGELKEYTYGIYGNYSQLYHINKNWYVESTLGLHLSYYENVYKYGNGTDDWDIDILDNSVFNVSTLALIVEPEVGGGYEKKQEWGKWRAHHNTSYIYGHGISGSIKKPSNINPEGMRLTNGIEFTIDVPELWGVHDFLSIDFRRIDVLGDLNKMAKAGLYYETSVGWVIDTKNKIPMLDNIGIGLSVNYGSSISGGTLVLYYNE